MYRIPSAEIPRVVKIAADLYEMANKATSPNILKRDEMLLVAYFFNELVDIAFPEEKERTKQMKMGLLIKSEHIKMEDLIISKLLGQLTNSMNKEQGNQSK